MMGAGQGPPFPNRPQPKPPFPFPNRPQPKPPFPFPNRPQPKPVKHTRYPWVLPKPKAKLYQELRNRVFGNSGHANRRTDRIALHQRANDLNLLLDWQPVHMNCYATAQVKSQVERYGCLLSEEEIFSAQGKAHARAKRLRSEIATATSEAMERAKDFAAITRRVERSLSDPQNEDVPRLVRNLRFDSSRLLGDTASRLEEIYAKTGELRDLEEQIQNF